MPERIPSMSSSARADSVALRPGDAPGASVGAREANVGRAEGLGPGSLRALLVVGGVFFAALAFAAGSPETLTRVDPELARLLRGMALIKASLVVAIFGAVFWRFAWPVSGGLAAAYLAGAWGSASAGVLIWQLSHIAAAALVFHLGLAVLLLGALADGRRGTALRS